MTTATEAVVMAGPEDDKDVLLEKVLDAAQGGVGRSPLYVWMWQRYDRLKGAFNRPDWKKMAAEFEAAGITDAKGEGPSATTVRQTWWKVRRDKDALAAERRRKVAAEGVRPPAPAPVADATPIPVSPRPIRNAPDPMPAGIEFREDAGDEFGLSGGPLPPRGKEDE